MAGKGQKAVLIVCLLLSVVFVVGAVVLFCSVGILVDNQITNNVQLKPNSSMYSNWMKPAVPVYLQFYMFHVKNPDGVQHNKELPDLEQKGPYTYLEVQTKGGVEFHNNGTLTYHMTKSYIFQPSLSNGTENDTACNINLFVISAVQLLKGRSKIFKWVASFLMEVIEKKKALFVEHTVREWLWGYHDPLLDDLKWWANKLGYKIDLPDKVGIYYGKNNTGDGNYTIFTGTKGSQNFTKIQLWKGLPNVPFWETPQANMINGTDGTSFPPFVDKDSTMFIFSSDLCRSMYIRYNQSVQLHGINLYRFVVPGVVFANSSVNPANWGFCSGGRCLGAGVLNVSVCQQGKPVIMSLPHFYMAAPEYLNAVTGLHPSPDLSQTFIDIEPNTGVVLRAAKKLQVNIIVEPVAGIHFLKNINQLIMPFVWVDENAAADAAAANKFKRQVLSLIDMVFILKVLVLAVALCFFLIMCVVTMFCAFRSRRTTGDRSHLINEDMEEREGVKA